MKWLERHVSLLMCLGVFFFRASTTIPVNADSTVPKLKELEKKLSELEDGVEQYKEQKTSSLQTAVRSTEVVADLMTPEDKELIDRLVARMKFLQAQRAAEKSRQTEGVSDQDKSPQQQDIRQDKSEGQFQDPAGQQETREVDLNWADQAVDDVQLGVDAETSKCTDSNCLGEKAEALLELERKLLAAMNYAKLHGISVSQLLSLLQSAKSTKKAASEEVELALLQRGS